jgi:hypothetical protein
VLQAPTSSRAVVAGEPRAVSRFGETTLVNARPRILIIPVTLGVVATLLFAMQGGFGGGHGSLDQAIFALGLPGVLASLVLPSWPGDFLGFVLLPAVINIALWFCAHRMLFVRRHKRG